MNILDAYVRTTPTAQNLIDIFQGEWSSVMPGNCGLVSLPGSAGLFEDPRIAWAIETMGGVAGKSLLELGPLEGGHSYMLQNAGVKSVIAIEANTRAFLKCLLAKEIFKLDRVEFRLGDFVSYLQTCDDRFDAVIASGVVYHVIDPLTLLEDLSRITDKLFLWTHYYDPAIIDGAEHLRQFFDKPASISFDGRRFQQARKRYENALAWQGFCGGVDSDAVWLDKELLLAALTKFGFSKLQLAFEQPDHPNGPALALSASR